MDRENFLKEMGDAPNLGGDGVRRDIDVDMRNAYLPADASALTTTLTTNPGFAMFETNGMVLRWNAGIVVAAGFEFYVPADYDQSADELRLRALVQMTGATDTPAWTANVFKKTPGSALSANLGPITAKTYSAGLSPLTAGQAANFASSNAAAVAVFDVSKLNVKAGDTIFVTLAPAAHGTDGAILYELVARIRSTLVTYNVSDR